MNNTGNKEIYAGIDLGTTNSVLAVVHEGINGKINTVVLDISRPVEVSQGIGGRPVVTTTRGKILPSYVYYDVRNRNMPIVGDMGKAQYPLRPYYVAKSVKSQMGSPQVTGLAEDVPDKRPAEVASRILAFMKQEGEKRYRTDISDVVITVPASFDPAMCQATVDAAELAGFRVKNPDGSKRPVLLPEPDAIIYDLVNQIRNGEVPDTVLELETGKNVMVFDLGGGTLDITLHHISRAEEDPEIIKVDAMATNRYTLLGGDTLDMAIANGILDKFLEKNRRLPDMCTRIRAEVKEVIPGLLRKAEELKLELSQGAIYGGGSGWLDEEDEEIYDVTGNIKGYTLDVSFTKGELEELIGRFMGYGLSYEDYKRVDSLPGEKNIIYPILEVLKKAADIRGEDIVVDGVIVSGGMSKLYMITDRLREFFGFEPIIAVDPDQSVARGAAIYHYLLKKHAQLKEGLINLEGVESTNSEDITGGGACRPVSCPRPGNPLGMEWGNVRLNDSLYIGVRNGGVYPIIKTGTKLPHESRVMGGFEILAGQDRIVIPVKSRNLDNSYRTIARGEINFKEKYSDGAYVSIQVSMDADKVITMHAQTSTDRDGHNILEEGEAVIYIDNRELSSGGVKLAAPMGSSLNPVNEINTLLMLSRRLEELQRSNKIAKIQSTSKNISSAVKRISRAANREEFAPVILSALQDGRTCNIGVMHLMTIARRMGESWSREDREELARLGMERVSGELLGLTTVGIRKSISLNAINLFSICGSDQQVEQLSRLRDRRGYRFPFLYIYARRRCEIYWLIDELFKDIVKLERGEKSNINNLVWAIGVAMRNDGGCYVAREDIRRVVEGLIYILEMGSITREMLVLTIIALGLICDNRYLPAPVDRELFARVEEAIHSLPLSNPYVSTTYYERRANMVLRMLHGTPLEAEEEQYLLGLIREENIEC